MKTPLESKFAVIGYPLTHSLSPEMHNAAFRARKFPYTYTRIPLQSRQIAPFFKKMKQGDFLGLNVTVPYKETVLKYMDELTEDAKLIGAVNTVHLENGKLKGFNTDGEGYVQSLIRELRFQPAKKKIVILGAGGAARSLVVSLCKAEADEIIVLNRSLKRAGQLIREFQDPFPKTRLRAGTLEAESLHHSFPRTDLLVQATSAGLYELEAPALPWSDLPESALVSDLIYRPALTPFLSAARKEGFRIHFGWAMLLYQGAAAFEIWTGHSAPVRVMKDALMKALKNE